MLPSFFLTLGVGCLGGWLFLRFRVPAGGMIGAMICVAIFNLFSNAAYFPWYSKLITQGVAGAFLAVPLTWDKVKAFRHMAKPAIMVVSGMLLASILLGLLCAALSPMSYMTAFLAAAPGGMTDLVLIAGDLGGDPVQVSAIHILRVFIVLSFFPAVDKQAAAYLIKKKPEIYARGIEPLPEEADNARVVPVGQLPAAAPAGGLNLCLSLTVALLAGFLGYYSGMPGGPLLFSLVFLCLFNLVTGRAYIPLKLKRFTQMCAGSLIGSGVNMTGLQSLRVVLVPALIIFAGYVVLNIALGLVLFYWGELDIHSALFAAVPAGVSDMAMIADELAGEGAKVALLQMLRLIATVTIFPQVFLWFEALFLG